MINDWDGYEPCDSEISGPPKTLPRAEARRAFKHCMETKPARLEMLSRLLKANGVEPQERTRHTVDFIGRLRELRCGRARNQ